MEYVTLFLRSQIHSYAEQCAVRSIHWSYHFPNSVQENWINGFNTPVTIISTFKSEAISRYRQKTCKFLLIFMYLPHQYICTMLYFRFALIWPWVFVWFQINILNNFNKDSFPWNRKKLLKELFKELLNRKNTFCTW